MVSPAANNKEANVDLEKATLNLRCLPISEDPEALKIAKACMRTSGRRTCDITFSGVKYIVPAKDGSAHEVLKGVSGQCASGRLTAIMGASGAGKTTLLDVLACNDTGGTVEGNILVNGERRQMRSFQRNAGYVLQRDVLLASATVKEAITLCALLKLPKQLPKSEKLSRVKDILRELELETCQHTLIGDDMQGIKGISGGQRRRVSVGMELVKDPAVLFLDEPTSGLDSEIAGSLMEMLVTLARRGRTVVVTIHQPNSLITALFDDFMLLAGGEMVYGGPWAGAVGAFESVGCSCPQYMNPSDHFLAVLRDPDVNKALVQRQSRQGWGGEGALTMLVNQALGEVMKTPPAGPFAAGTWVPGSEPPGSKPASTMSELMSVLSCTGLRAGDAETGAGEGRHRFGMLGRLSGTASRKTLVMQPPGASAPMQVYLLASRMVLMWVRSPTMLLSELSQYIFMAVFVGLMYLQVSDVLPSGPTDRVASIWFSMAILSFTPSYTAVTVWDRERVLLRRELQQGMYGPLSWYLARTLTVTPFQIVQTMLYAVITFFAVGYWASAARFFVYWGAFCMFALVSETIGMLAALLTKNSTYAVLLLTFVLLLLLSFSGFIVSKVPVYFKWISKISYLTYAFSGVVIDQFDGMTFHTPNGAPIPGTSIIPASVNNGLSVVANLMTLFGIWLGVRALAYAALLGVVYTRIL